MTLTKALDALTGNERDAIMDELARLRVASDELLREIQEYENARAHNNTYHAV